MSDETNNKTKKIGGLDIKKARAIILDAIGDNKKEKSGDAKKTPTPPSPSPLFFKDKKFIKPRKEIKLSESEKAKGIQEVKRISGEDSKANKGSSPLFFKKKKKYINAEKESKGKSADKHKPVKEKKSAAPSAKKTSKTSGHKRLRQERRREDSILSKIKLIPREKSLAWPRRAQSAAGAVIYIFVIAILLFIIFYSLFVGLIIKFDIDNKVTRNLSGYLPVPVAITETGVVEYYTYKDALEQNNGNYTGVKIINQ